MVDVASMVPAPFPAPTVALPGGGELPQLGFGTYKVAPAETERVVLEALQAGYRHIDTATMYGNEAEVGRALQRSGLARDEVFVTTKLNNPDVAPDQVRAAFERSLQALGLEQVDLYLIHWPMPRTTDYVARWRTLTEFLGDGRARAIGVSNFTEEHLRRCIDATGVVPAVNQIEVSPFLNQRELRAVHAELGIVTEAWSPLARGRAVSDPGVHAVAEALGCTPAQAVIAWHLRRGDVVIPKTTSPERMRENAEALVVAERFDADAMRAMDALNRDERSGSGPDDVELGQKK